MTIVKIKYVPSLKKYTVANVEDWHLLKRYNTYCPEHPDYFWNHQSAFVTLERLEAIRPSAAKDNIHYSVI